MKRYLVESRQCLLSRKHKISLVQLMSMGWLEQRWEAAGGEHGLKRHENCLKERTNNTQIRLNELGKKMANCERTILC